MFSYSITDRMLLKLYLAPTLLLVASILSLWIFGDLIPDYLSHSKLFVPLANTVKQFTGWVSISLTLTAILWYTSSTYRVWRWQRCEGDLCYTCGGITVYKVGRYGPYFHCIACGKNRADR